MSSHDFSTIFYNVINGIMPKNIKWLRIHKENSTFDKVSLPFFFFFKLVLNGGICTLWSQNIIFHSRICYNLHQVIYLSNIVFFFFYHIITHYFSNVIKSDQLMMLKYIFMWALYVISFSFFFYLSNDKFYWIRC